jgi:hypothetical protein
MTRLKRKYKIGDKFIPKDENMFWKEYKIVNYVAGIPKDEHLGFSYSIECKPTQADKPHQIMNIVEHLINSRMESISEKVEYKIKVVGEYVHKGIKVSVTEKDPDTGMEFPYFTASVWADKTPELKEDEFVLKNYSENEGLDSLLLTHGVIELVGETAIVGRCECPVVRLTKKNSWFAEPL